MYFEFFKLWDEPFGATPDPAYLYPSPTHLYALDSLRNGILGGRGFMTLIAEPGLGKTTLLYQLIEQLPQTTRTAYLFQTQCNSLEFMQYLLHEVGINPDGMGLVAMHKRLNEMLFNEMVQGKQFVLIVDESQNLSNAVLETIRLLSNFETAHSKLLQIVLAGQAELANKLEQPDLSQLLQRINVMASLDALSFDETAAYIRHRLKLAGHAGEDLFDPAGFAAVYRRSVGVPRNINRICHAALSQAAAEKSRVVTAAIVEKSNRGLGPTIEELQRSRFASQPRTMAPPKASAQASPQFRTPQPAPSQVAVTPPQPPAPVEPPPPAPPPPISDAHQASPIPPPELVSPLPDFVPRKPERRSNRWLGWTAVFTTLLILAVLAAPSSLRQALLQKIQPIVGSASSLSDPPPGPSVPSRVPSAPDAKHATSKSAGVIDTPRDDTATTKGFKIVIDPGHGGAESGIRGPNGLLEKSVCLEVALRLGQLIEDSLPGAEVVYTRSDDQNLPASRRAAFANESSADLFISIHADSLANDQVIQVYYADGGSEKKSVGPVSDRAEVRAALRLAGDVQDALSRQFKQKDDITPVRAPAQPTFAGLNGIRAPAVLVEIPFSEAESPLLDPEKRQQVAEGVYRGVAAFVKDLPDRAAH